MQSELLRVGKPTQFIACSATPAHRAPKCVSKSHLRAFSTMVSQTAQCSFSLRRSEGEEGINRDTHVYLFISLGCAACPDDTRNNQINDANGAICWLAIIFFVGTAPRVFFTKMARRVLVGVKRGALVAFCSLYTVRAYGKIIFIVCANLTSGGLHREDPASI